ncbi:MAG: hypothetical protein ACRDRP_12265 [Pseudonocardiaceae bacterium]
MSDTVSFAELDRQHVELLPTRTVLSLFSTGDGGTASNGTPGIGKVGVNVLGFPLIPGSGNGIGTDGASADG